MHVLALETATLRVSVALVSEGGVLAERAYPPGDPASVRLLEGVEEVCRAAAVPPEKLDGLAVSVGPGSFTGLRVGMATAQGLAFALGVPIAPISTLEALAWNLPDATGLICPILDAKQGEVYAAIYRWAPDGCLAGLGDERVLTPRKLAAEILVPFQLSMAAIPHDRVATASQEAGRPYSGKQVGTALGAVTFLGDGVGRYEAEIRPLLPQAVFAPPVMWYPTAAKVGTLGHALLVRGEGVQPEALRPRYLRRAEAEVRWEKRLMNKQ